MRRWQRRGALAWLLLPLAALFGLLSALRRSAYRHGLLPRVRLAVPVIIVGNLIVGGAGKTPLVIWLAERLKARGRHPGIVSRGYGRRGEEVLEVLPDMAPRLAGDEPVLLARRTGCPVFVGRDRVAAAQALLKRHPDCDVILCDDGLQHYRLARDVEIVVIDRRGLMNGWLLPAGPLREPASRLGEVSAVVFHGMAPWPALTAPTFSMQLEGAICYRLDDPRQRCAVSALAGRRVHAVAGIGEPQRFFDHLAALGLSCQTHAFDDHHEYVASDLAFDAEAIVTTEKDALKCLGLTALPIWVLPVEARVEPDLSRLVVALLETRCHGSAPA